MGWLVDVSFVLFLLLQTYLGWRSGLLWQAAGLASLLLGVALGLWLAPTVGVWLQGVLAPQPFHGQLLAFILVAGLTGLTFRVLATWAEWESEHGVPKKEREKRRGQDRILGGIFGAFKGLVVLLLCVSLAAALWPEQMTRAGSRLAPPFAIAGARLLPAGSVRRVQSWVASAADHLHD